MLELAKDFAVDVVKLCRSIKTQHHESVLTNQLMRSATSIGANLHEARYAQSTADFISKRQIALKECHESEYWLELLVRKGKLSQEDYRKLLNACGTIRRRLIASITTAKENAGL
jgi:four helix bundle protein